MWICFRIKNCVRLAAKVRCIRTSNESFNCNGTPLFAARKFFLNRNVALHTCSLRPPCVIPFGKNLP